MKSYNSLSSYGNANLIITGWIEGNYVYCQWFLHIEHHKEERATDVAKVNINQLKKLAVNAKTDQDLLESWMGMMRQTANCELLSLLLKIAQSTNKPDPEGNIQFDQSNDFTGMLIFLRKKFPDFLSWMNKNTQYQGMKELIEIATGIVDPES